MTWLTIALVAVVSAALVAGAAWGFQGTFPTMLEGFIIALAGGALMVSSGLELIDPATDVAALWTVAPCVLAGAGVFVGLDRVVKQRLGSDSGGGLLAAITLDRIPENHALGVALIGAGSLQVASLDRSFSPICPRRPEGLRRWPKGGRERRSWASGWARRSCSRPQPWSATCCSPVFHKRPWPWRDASPAAPWWPR